MSLRACPELRSKPGPSKEEIAEALDVAMAMNAGTAIIYSLRAMDAVHAHSGAK